ncbi:MOSC domain-containing protein [Rubrivirga sp.]|uniref:MOSC domain-containing protein n=1 Tax=Rubrivirga sp. TaxID=1885344 RepID=UPI003B519436
MPGRLVAIYLAPAAGAPVRRLSEAEALAGLGLDGDRYAASEGSFSRWPGPARDVTLIAAEALADAEREFGVAVAEGQHRRNLVVEGVPLDDLRGVPFRIGEVAFEGVRLCAPCKYLVRVTGQDRIFDALVRRGGLRAAVLETGVLREGDAVTWDPADVARRRSLPG